LPDRQRYRTNARLVILVLAAVSAYSFAVLLQEQDYLWALIPGAALGLLSISEFVLADIILDTRFPRETTMFLERLQRKLATTSTHEEILRTLGRCVDSFVACDRERISSALHLTVETVEAGTAATSTGLVQISDYTRPGLGGRRWRVLKATQGIVGRCVRVGEMVHVNFRTDAEYRKRMVEEFGFSRAEAERHTKAARSYLAFPIINSGEVVGVMYFFSTEPQVFPIATDRAVLERNAEVIAGFLRAAEIL
jgi:GAF domain-containing protein